MFIDLISHLILRIVAANGGPDLFKKEDQDTIVDISNFKLILYTSFTSKNESIALDLIECLSNLCK